MKIGIYTNLTRDNEGRATLALVNVLKKNKLEILLSEQLNVLGLDLEYLSNEELAKESDIVIVFGGDGTILRIAKECAKFNTDIFAVNLGHLGFLSAVENKDMLEIYNEITSGNYKIDVRRFLEAEYNGKKFVALNEAVIERGSKAKLLKTEIRVDGAYFNRFNSDGIIVSTPTGSTAYALSAGGPILSPDLAALLIVPVCPHSLYSRPLVINDEHEITIKLLENSDIAHLNIDGGGYMLISSYGEVVIRKSELQARFIRLPKYNYYEKLLEKMGRWSNVD